MKLLITTFCLFLFSILTSFAQRPNIIFFFVDDLGYGDIGCFWQDAKTGTQKFDTPHIDTMAAEGAKLTHHYISASVCAPSRASLMQGRHQGHCDVRNSQFDKALPNNHTVSDMLQRAGYRTIHVGKAGLAGGEGSTNLSGTGSQNLAAHPLDRGFDEFFGYLFHADGHEHFPRNGTTNKGAYIYHGYQQITNASVDLYTTDAWTAYAKHAIITEHNDGDNQPFFLYVAYDTPHQKMQRPSVAYPAGGGLTGGIQWTTATDASGNTRYASTADGTGAVDGYNHPDNNTAWPLSNQQHVGMIRRMDNSIGDIIQLLKDLGIDNNTICIFSSDNGPHNEQHNPRYFESFANMEGIKRDMWEAGIRVPTVVRWPTHIAGATGNPNNIHEISYPMAIWDWMPTFADLADVPAPAWCDGVSVVPTLTGNGTQRDKGYLYFEFSNGGSTPNWAEFPNHRGETKGQMQCIRIGNHMGVRTGITSATNDFKIYDVTTDPGQASNLAASMPSLQTKMKDLALQARRPAGHATRPYDSANLAPVTLTTIQGLEYTAHEGSWSYVPEFRDMAATASGNVTGIDLSVRSRDSDCGILFSGYIQIPTTGSYTFYLSSDDGANLFIHDAHVIDDDFNHNGSERSGSINLSAGMHPIRIYYRHNAAASHALNVSWQGPSISKQTIPNASLFRAGTPPPEPNAQPDQSSTPGTTQVSIPVLANDTDDGLPSALTIQSVSNPSFGTATISGSNVLYTADAGKYGSDQFTYTITDGQFTAQATVTVTVTVPSNNLWFPLNETSGSTVAEAGGLVAGTLSGFSNPDAAHVVGKHGYGLTFNGTTDQVSLSGITLPTGNSPRTVAAWVRTSTTSPSELQVIFGYGVNTNGRRFSFRLDGSATQRLRLEVQGGFIIGTTQINDGNWHHVAVVVDDFNNNGTTNVNEARLYVDGSLEAVSNSGSQTMDTSASGAILIGGSPHATGYNFTGEIDEVKIFNSALTGAEVAALAAETDQPAAAWLYRYHGATPPAWTSDDDNDGIDLLGEYAFGGNPNASDASGMTPSALYNSTSDQLEVTYIRRTPNSHDLTYTVQVSDDLNTWTLPSTEKSAIPHPTLGSDFQQVVVEADGSIPASGRRFIRIKAE